MNVKAGDLAIVVNIKGSVSARPQTIRVGRRFTPDTFVGITTGLGFVAIAILWATGALS